jgi:hypothetical protein
MAPINELKLSMKTRRSTSTQASVIRHSLKFPHWLPEAFGNPNFAEANRRFTTGISRVKNHSIDFAVSQVAA